ESLSPLPPLRPKSILRRHRSLQVGRVDSTGRPRSISYSGPEPNSSDTTGRPRSVSCSIGAESSEFDIPAPPFHDDYWSDGSELSKASSSNRPDLKRRPSFVHFDPTITVRECVGGDTKDDQESNWFSEDELRTFMKDTINLCHSSAVNAIQTYSLPSVKKAYEAAHEAGVKSPILSSTNPEHRALFAEPVLHVTDEDSVVHDGSKRFFKIMSKEMQRVLIVDNSLATLKLFQRHILSMFPHVQIDTAVSGEVALDKIEVDWKRAGINYDLIIVEERLQQRLSVEANDDESLDLTGSELLRLVNEMESSALSNCKSTKQEEGKPSKAHSRRSLKIGVSVSLGEDCESLRNRGGADLFWSKPPPKPSNGLRNQILNALVNKRGKSVFICGC
ncbi:hypothetical protein ACHAXR_003368, partial [Thalassiosira sp. AJA248-18]